MEIIKIDRQQKKNPGYQAIHIWLRKTFGRAKKCENPKCEDKCKIYEWALWKGKEYIKKRENFRMLCKSCHKKYDYTDEAKKKISNALVGIKRSKETLLKMGRAKRGNTFRARLTLGQVSEIRESYDMGDTTQKELGEIFGVTRTQIGYIVNYKSWK